MKEFLTVFLFLVTVSAPAQNGELPRSTFRHPTVGKASCVPTIKEDPAVVLKAHGIVTKNLSQTYVRYVAEIVSMMSSLAGKKLTIFKGTEVIYNPKMDIVARQTNGPIELSAEGMGIKAVYVHEIGHVVGNAKNERGQTYYQAYNSKVTMPCYPTQYSMVSHGYGRRNEEFAEVMTAYLLAPDMLLTGGQYCRQAYDFFRSELFTASYHRCEESGRMPEQEK